MQRLIWALLCVCVLLENVAFAESKVKDIPPGDGKIVPLKAGDKAPFSGQLFDQATALRWANWLLQYEIKSELDEDLYKNLSSSSDELWKKKLEVEKEKYDTVTKDYQNTISVLNGKIADLEYEVRNPPWYKSVWFGFLTGCLVTTAAVAIGAHASK